MFKFLTIIISVVILSSCVGKSVAVTGNKDKDIYTTIANESTGGGGAPAPKVEIVNKDKDTGFKVENVTISIPISYFHFATAKYEIPNIGKKYATGLAKIIRTFQEQWDRIEIVGHADIRGIDERNIPLSLNRAKTIQDIMVSNGVDKAKIVISGKGSSEPINPEETKAAYAENRRVEIRIFGQGDAKALTKAITEYNQSQPK